jgi:hypothetical protein
MDGQACCIVLFINVSDRPKSNTAACPMQNPGMIKFMPEI